MPRPKDLVHALKYAEHLFRRGDFQSFVQTAYPLLAANPYETDGLRLIDAIDARLMLASVVADRHVAEHHLFWARCGIEWAFASGWVHDGLLKAWKRDVARVLGLVRGINGVPVFLSEWSEEDDSDDQEEYLELQIGEEEVRWLLEEIAEPLDENMVQSMRIISLDLVLERDCKTGI